MRRPYCAVTLTRMTNFLCPSKWCGHAWSMEADSDGLYDGYGIPPCPKCGHPSVDADDYGDFRCPEGHTFRRYGNGGLTFGMVPECEEHGLQAEFV